MKMHLIALYMYIQANTEYPLSAVPDSACDFYDVQINRRNNMKRMCGPMKANIRLSMSSCHSVHFLANIIF